MFITIVQDEALIVDGAKLLLVSATSLPLIRKCIKEGIYEKLSPKQFNNYHHAATNGHRQRVRR